MGIHPVEKKNMRPWKKIRTYRFCSETLPNDPNGGDKNTIYPVVKRLLPASLLKKDITARNPMITIKDIQGGDDIYVEFVSYGQEVQTQAGVQRESIYIDENCNRTFYEEQIPRLFASDGDMIVGMTPALGQITWQYEDFYEKAKTIIRTPIVAARYHKRFGTKLPLIQNTESKNSICVLAAATDDNPYYDELVTRINNDEISLITQGLHTEFKEPSEYKLLAALVAPTIQSPGTICVVPPLVYAMVLSVYTSISELRPVMVLPGTIFWWQSGDPRLSVTIMLVFPPLLFMLSGVLCLTLS